jgi:hypothetical protein
MMGRFREGLTQVVGRNLKGDKAIVTFDWTSTGDLWLRIDLGSKRGSSASLNHTKARRLGSALLQAARWSELHLADQKGRKRRTV